ncbi:MAG: hypothetical protein QXQ31_07330 [Zestosphaera sp.]
MGGTTPTSDNFEEDPRLRRTRNEFITMILFGFVLYSIAYWSLIVSYGSKPRSLIWGIPWWFYLLIISVIFAAVLIIITAVGMKEEPLEPWLKR